MRVISINLDVNFETCLPRTSKNFPLKLFDVFFSTKLQRPGSVAKTCNQSPGEAIM